MGLCVKCIYHLNEGKDVMKRISGTNTMIHITHFCKHPNYVKMDYVTGEVHYESCYALNGFEECPNWDGGQVQPDPDTPAEDPTTSGENIDITPDINDGDTENEGHESEP